MPKGASGMTARGSGDFNDFIIDSTSVMEVTVGDNRFFTMAISRRDTTYTDRFENLVIVANDTVRESYIATYFAAQEYYDELQFNVHAPYIGGFSFTQLNDDRRTSRGGGDDNIVCKPVTMSFCNWSPNNDGSVHVAGPNCGSIFWTITVTVCDVVALPPRQPAINLNLKDNNAGGGGGGGGPRPGIPPKPVVVTQPIPPLDQSPDEKNCKELKKLTDNTRIKDSFDDLEEKVWENRENGYTFRKTGELYRLSETPRSEYNPNMLQVEVGGNVIGQSHTHPNPQIDENVPMFSPGDINSLYQIAKNHDNGGQAKDFSLYFITLTVPSGTYALKIDHWTKFRKAIDFRFKEFRNNIYRKYQHPTNEETDKLIKGLLEIIQDEDMGVGLYKANENLTSWSKLTLNPLDSSITTTNCN